MSEKTKLKHEAIELVEIIFDNLENHNPYDEKVHGVFVEDEHFSAHDNIDKYLKQLPPQKMYLGWDNIIYPRFELRHIKVNP